MGLKKWFGRGREDDESDSLVEFTLSAMKVGYLVDYDMETWEVTAYNTYDYSGFEAREWVIESSDKVVYLERSDSEGEVSWTLTESISLSQISEDVIEHTLRHDNPPKDLTYDGRSHRLMESGAGLFHESAEGPGTSFISWTYSDESGRNVLFVTQYGERDFKSVAGEYVEEYQFTNILPGGNP
jgi:hypothetical protein